MAINEQGLMAALGAVQDPGTGKDFVSTRALRDLRIDGDAVSFQVELGYPARSQEPALRYMDNELRRLQRQYPPVLNEAVAQGVIRDIGYCIPDIGFKYDRNTYEIHIHSQVGYVGVNTV